MPHDPIFIDDPEFDPTDPMWDYISEEDDVAITADDVIVMEMEAELHGAQFEDLYGTDQQDMVDPDITSIESLMSTTEWLFFGQHQTVLNKMDHVELMNSIVTDLIMFNTLGAGNEIPSSVLDNLVRKMELVTQTDDDLLHESIEIFMALTEMQFIDVDPDGPTPMPSIIIIDPDGLQAFLDSRETVDA